MLLFLHVTLSRTSHPGATAMTPSLTTQNLRAVFALPLLAVALAAAFGAGTVPSPATHYAEGDHALAAAPGPDSLGLATDTLGARGVATTLPGDPVLAAGPTADCDGGVAPVGARGLARMPGDITAVAVRLRCAQ